MKKLLLLLITILLLTSCSAEKTLKDDIYIFYTSDVHCGVDAGVTYASLKALVDDTKAEHNNVMLVDAGDFIQGESIGILSRGQLPIELMNDMNYDIVTIGNHEFDYGVDTLKELMANFNGEIVASNVKYFGKKGNIFESYPEFIIKEFDGVKIGFIGVLTPSTITTSTPSHFEENGELVYNFYSEENGKALFDKIQSVVDEVKKHGVKYVIALSHLGSTSSSEPYDVFALVNNTSGIDVVIDGHSHSMIVGDLYPNKEGKDVLITSVGTKLEAVGELIIGKDGSITSMHITEYNRQDENIINSVNNAYKQVDTVLSEKITTIDFDLNILDEEGIRIVRSRETNLGDLVADALRERQKADIAIANGGSIRNTIEAGDVTYGDLLSVLPFQNRNSACYATGQQILDTLEFTSRFTDSIYKFDEKAVGESGGFLQVSGLKYTIDTSIESSVLVDDNNMFAGFANDQRRVKDVYVLENGEYVPIDVNKTYIVASSDYVLFESGDGNNIFKDCERIRDYEEIDIDGFVSYIKENGISDKYKEAENRITIE